MPENLPGGEPLNPQELRASFGVSAENGGFNENPGDKDDAKEAVVVLRSDDLNDEGNKLSRENKEKKENKFSKSEFILRAKRAIFEDEHIDNQSKSSPENKSRLETLRQDSRDELEEVGINIEFLTGGKGREDDKKTNRVWMRRRLGKLERSEKLNDKDTRAFERLGVTKEKLQEWVEEGAEEDVPVPEPGAKDGQARRQEERVRDVDIVGQLDMRIERQNIAIRRAISATLSAGQVPNYLALTRDLTNINRKIIEEMGKESTSAGDVDRLAELSAKCARYVGEIQSMGATSEISSAEGDVPKNGDPVAWREWVRKKISSIAQPFLGSGELREKNTNSLFTIKVRTTAGPMEKSAFLYAPEEVKKQFEGDGDEIGLVRRVTDLFDTWRNYRKDFKSLSTKAFEEDSSYKFPDRPLCNSVLREMDGNRNELGLGSKYIAEAVRLYWLMAKGEIGTVLPGANNLFNEKLSVADANRTRDLIASRSGGAYFEEIGLMMAGFLGIVGKGNVSKDAVYSDGLAVLQNIDKAEFLSSEMKASFVSSGATEKISFMPSLADLQKKGDGTKAFCVVRIPPNDLVLKESLSAGEVDSGLTMQDLIESRKLCNVRWNEGVDVFALIKKRESQAVKLANMFSESKDTLQSLLESPQGDPKNGLLYKRLETINDALGHYDFRTRQRVVFLWIWTQMENNPDWKKDENVQLRTKLLDTLFMGKYDNAFGTSRDSEMKKGNNDNRWLHGDDLKELGGAFYTGGRGQLVGTYKARAYFKPNQKVSPNIRY